MTGIVEEKTESNDSQPNENKLKNVHLQNLKKASQMNGEVTGPVENGAVDLPNGDIPNGDHSPEDEKEDSELQEEEQATDKSTDSLLEDKAVVKKPEDVSTADKDQEVVVIQDTGFNIIIKAPGLESFELQVSSMELVQEIYQVLIDREDTCSRTCFSLQLEGQTMDNFAELKTIEGLEEGSVIKVVEEPYTVREARIHVRHVRDLLKSVDSQDAYNAVDCNSLSFLNVISGETGLEKSVKAQEAVDCTPPDYIVPGSKERPLAPLHPSSKLIKAPQCLKILTYSGWNPPPGNRRMHGDVLYLYVVTLEDKRYHVTASTRGFYVNNCTQDEFNPRPASQKHLSHSLIDLLSQISPAFKRNFQVLLKQRSKKHPFERVATPYQIYSWLAPAVEHSVDFIRAEDSFSSRLGYEEHIPGQTRDWNSELQTTRELPRKALPERLIRERAVFKVHSDFVVAATRGAISVIDGNIMAINPGEDAKMQMFLWNNIFFSLGFDVKDHYKEFGGDAAAYASPGSDLQGVRAYSSVDEEGLYTLGTVVVDYRGYRVTAQSIIPGILEREQEQSVVYGSIDFGKTVVNEEKYNEFLRKTATALKIRPHKVLNDKDEEVELHSSVECKGIVGDDGRHYVLDLLRTFPPDANYLPVEGEELSDEVKAMGYPRKHRHKIVTLRQELIDAFVENRYIAFVKQAAFQFQQLRLKKLQSDQSKQDQEKPEDSGAEKDKLSKTELIKEEDLEAEEAKKIVNELTTDSSSYEESTKEIVQKACKEVSSLSDTEFDISFNPDVFQPSVRHVNPEGENYKREKNLVKDAAKFLLLHQIPSFIRDCLEHASSPIDGYTLTEALHHNGINMRYLGKVTEMVAKYPQLSYLHSICVAELICRSVKHLFKVYMQGVETMSLSAAVSHFLNCFIGVYLNPHTQVATDELYSQRSKKRNRRKNKAYGSLVMSLSQDNTDWATESPRSLWRKIVDEVREYHNYKLECDCSEAAVEKYGFQKVSLLRSFCKKCGIQLLLREYSLDSKSKQTFFEEDIVNIFPSVKHIHPKATDAYHVFTSGQNKIQQGLLRDGYELISEALNLLNNVYGAMHPEIAACARLLARLNYIMNDYSEALLYQQRAVLMSERVLGIDHPNTITEYAHLALYSYANKEIPTALKLMYRARYLALLCCGENHPEVALFDTNIGVILHAVFEFDLSLRFLHKALELNTKFFGAVSLKVAMNYHLVARTYSCKGDFRTALQNEKEAFSIYKKLLTKDHERTKESSECLKHLTQQAVNFQKTMNQLSKGDSVSSIPPIQIQTPSLASVLETLNHINGIVFLHISQDDIDKFRDEMVKRQRQTPGDESAEETQGQGQKETSEKNSPTNSSPSTTSSATSTTTSTTTTSNTSAINATQTVEENSKQASDINANIARDDEASR